MAEYIERGAAYRAIEIACNGCPCEKTVAGSVCHDCSIMKAKSELQALPAADVRPVVRGEWIPAPEKGDCIYRCSQCGYEIDSYLCEAKNFCPNCGADMREEN